MDSNMQILPLGPPPPMSNNSSAVPEVDVSVWRAIAGAAAKIPAVKSYVYYFPQGHLEQSSSSYSHDASDYNFTLTRPWIPCEVISLRFLSNASTDEAFVKMVLQPLQPLGPRSRDDRIDDDDADPDIVSFVKILTRSDANNGGGFSVPRYCADMIFPQLDYSADPPLQTLVLKDTRGNAWQFRHIYRGTPRRHLLTTGWSKFVNDKRLVAGDSVVFIKRKSTNELFVGVRREEEFAGDRGEALAAIETALRRIPFEVDYYPKVGVPDFVVKAEKVKTSLRMRLNPGKRVRMRVETDDISRMTYIQGVISAVVTPPSGMWFASPWRTLQITWDDPEISINKVNPWQVEDCPFPPILEPEYPPSKKLKTLHDSESSCNNNTLPSTTNFTHSTAGHLSLALFNCPSFSSGIQEARRDHIGASRLSTINGGVSHQRMNELRNEPEPAPGAVSTVLSIGSSYSDTVSRASHSSGGADVVAQRPFHLFGNLIQLGDGGAGP